MTSDFLIKRFSFDNHIDDDLRQLNNDLTDNLWQPHKICLSTCQMVPWRGYKEMTVDRWLPPSQMTRSDENTLRRPCDGHRGYSEDLDDRLDDFSDDLDDNLWGAYWGAQTGSNDLANDLADAIFDNCGYNLSDLGYDFSADRKITSVGQPQL